MKLKNVPLAAVSLLTYHSQTAKSVPTHNEGSLAQCQTKDTPPFARLTSTHPVSQPTTANPRSSATELDRLKTIAPPPSSPEKDEQKFNKTVAEQTPLSTANTDQNINTAQNIGFGGAPNLAVPALSLLEWHQAQQLNDPLEQQKAKLAFATKIDDAFGRYGFLAIVDHGISEEKIDQAFEIAKAFFQLPRSEKMKLHFPELAGQRGYTPDGETAKGASTPDLKEFIQLGKDNNPTPKTLPEFVPTLESLIDDFSKLGRQLLEAIALHQLGDEHFFDDTIDDKTSILRLLHYPALPDNTPPMSVRAAAHEDINLITLLLNGRATDPGTKASGQGLQLRVPKNGVRAELANPEDFHWVNAVVPPGAMIINIGEMLENWTNGAWRATTHRVINPPHSSEERLSGRLSMPYFVHPKGNFSLNPHPKSIERAGGASHYRNITAHEALQERLRELGLLRD